MVKIKKNISYFNEFPKFCVIDIENSSIIYELSDTIEELHSMIGVFDPVKVVSYTGVDAIIEEPNRISSLFVTVRTGSILPEIYEGQELTWYEHENNPSKEITLDDILTSCSI